MSLNVLVLEDEESIRDFIVVNIKRAGYDILEACTGEDAIEIFNDEKIDIAILDVMLPGIDGFEVCKKMRENNKYVGIIMLTAKSMEEDKIDGLLNGADDYMVKPFSPKELVARVDSLGRRISVIKDDKTEPFLDGGLEVDFENRQIFKDGEEIELTQLEFSIVTELVKNVGKPLSRENILDRVWGENFFGSFKIVDVNMRRIRQKIEEDPSNPIYIQTVWGLGYKWRKGE